MSTTTLILSGAKGKDTFNGVTTEDGKMKHGTYKYSTGDVYECDFANDNKNAFQSTEGTFQWDNGHKYTGPFVNGEFEGHGTLQMNSYTYKGEFVRGKLHGCGELSCGDWKHIGKWEKDRCIE